MRRASPPRGADPRPFNDRLVFKPLAVVLLVPIVVLSGALTAIILAPPFIGAAMGVMRVDAKLDALGADFTRIPRFPERSTIYANDATTPLATVYLDNRELVRLNNVSTQAQEGRAGDRGLRLLRPRCAELELTAARRHRERAGGGSGPGWLHDHPAAGEEHPGARSIGSELRAEVPGAGPGDPRRGEVHEGRDLRAVSEPDLPGQRRVRDRHGGQVLLQEARVGADAVRGRHAGRHDPAALLLRPDLAPHPNDRSGATTCSTG